MTTKRSARAQRHRARLRRDPFGRLALAFGDYLETVGWRAVVVGKVAVAAEDLSKHSPGAFGRYQAIVSFTGGKFERHQRERGAHATRRVGRRP